MSFELILKKLSLINAAPAVAAPAVAELAVAESAAAECWDGYGVLDDNRSSQGSAVLERWVYEDDGNPDSRIPVEAADQWRDEYDVHDDSRCSQGNVVPECVCGIDGKLGSRILDEAADP